MLGIFAFQPDTEYQLPDANIYKNSRIVIPEGMKVEVDIKTGDVNIITEEK